MAITVEELMESLQKIEDKSLTCYFTCSSSGVSYEISSARVDVLDRHKNYLCGEIEEEGVGFTFVKFH